MLKTKIKYYDERNPLKKYYWIITEEDIFFPWSWKGKRKQFYKQTDYSNIKEEIK